uniref:Uncharacterized protein n=2 Tax=Meloidogyne hapla TaxID=6305 RepID=A0A1I8BKP1_MELHA
MIRTRLENLAKAQKRPLLGNLSVDQTSSSHQSTSQQHAEDQINVGTESDENSDPEIQLIQFDTGKTEKGKMCLWHAGYFLKQLNHHPSLSSFLEAFLKDVDKQLDIARAAVLQQKRKRRRRYVLQEQHIMETLEGAMYDNDEDLLDLLTLLGLQIQGYVNGLRDNNRRDSDDDDGIMDDL